MMEMLLFVALGISLVAIFLLLLSRSAAQNEPVQKPRDGHSELPTLPTELLMERIFGAEDWNFLRNRAPQAAQKQFLKERRELAFFWLALLRGRARTAMNFHLTQARSLHSVEPLLELRIAANYLAFQLSCSLVAGLLWLQGPVATRWVFHWADLLCGNLHVMTKVRRAGSTASFIVKG